MRSRGYDPLPLAIRLAKAIDRRGPDDCWEWALAPGTKGYGRLKVAGTNVAAHRVAYQALVGSVPDGVLVCHRCDNPPCCNPAHLFLGSASDNTQDSITKGRHNWVRDPATKGSQNFRLHNPRTKLTEQDVSHIRHAKQAGESAPSLAAVFGVHPITIYKIASGARRHG